MGDSRACRVCVWGGVRRLGPGKLLLLASLKNLCEGRTRATQGPLLIKPPESRQEAGMVRRAGGSDCRASRGTANKPPPPPRRFMCTTIYITQRHTHTHIQMLQHGKRGAYITLFFFPSQDWAWLKCSDQFITSLF